jgi:hypothetical protein
MRGLLLGIFALSTLVGAQQVADTDFRPLIGKPAYPAGTGPVVLIDEAHANFHTASGRYLPFAELLRRDGFTVRPSTQRFTAETLRAAHALVIANAQVPAGSPTAFTADEVEVVRRWVEEGGSLLLIADHPPFAAGGLELGKIFGLRFRNAGAVNPAERSGRLVFRRLDGTLKDHAVTKGIDEVATFTGCSFELESTGYPLLLFSSDVFSFAQSNEREPMPLKGHLQGAVLSFGKGRVAAFGEAAMFTAQITGEDRHPMGMNAPIAKQNPQFLLNLMHWLCRLP